MIEADFDVKDFENPEDTKGTYARFYMHAKRNDLASAEEGRPIFADCEYVEIISAGNANNIVRRPVSDIDRRRFHLAYAKFKEGDKEQITGTPLSEVPWLTRAQVEELAYLKCRSLEQLAGLSDQACLNTPGLFSIKKKAEAWLKKAEEAKPFTKLTQENDQLRSQVAALEEAMKDLKSIVAKKK